MTLLDGKELSKKYNEHHKKIRQEIKENKYPNIKKHLDNTTHFITSSNAPYGLHRDRSSKLNPFEII